MDRETNPPAEAGIGKTATRRRNSDSDRPGGDLRREWSPVDQGWAYVERITYSREQRLWRHRVTTGLGAWQYGGAFRTTPELIAESIAGPVSDALWRRTYRQHAIRAFRLDPHWHPITRAIPNGRPLANPDRRTMPSSRQAPRSEGSVSLAPQAGE